MLAASPVVAVENGSVVIPRETAELSDLIGRGYEEETNCFRNILSIDYLKYFSERLQTASVYVPKYFTRLGDTVTYHLSFANPSFTIFGLFFEDQGADPRKTSTRFQCSLCSAANATKVWKGTHSNRYRHFTGSHAPECDEVLYHQELAFRRANNLPVPHKHFHAVKDEVLANSLLHCVATRSTARRSLLQTVTDPTFENWSASYFRQPKHFLSRYFHFFRCVVDHDPLSRLAQQSEASKVRDRIDGTSSVISWSEIYKKYLPLSTAFIYAHFRDQSDQMLCYSLCTDNWSRHRRHFAGVVLTYVDQNLVVRSLDLGIRYSPQNSTGENISNLVQQVASCIFVEKLTWCIGVTADNAPNQVSGVNLAGVPSYGCLAHLLDLVIKSLLQNLPAIKRCVKIVENVRNGNLHAELYKRMASSVPCTQLVKFSKTRFCGAIFTVLSIILNYERVSLYIAEVRSERNAARLRLPSKKILIGIYLLLYPICAWINRLGKVKYNALSEVHFMLFRLLSLYGNNNSSADDLDVSYFKKKVLRKIFGRVRNISDDVFGGTVVGGLRCAILRGLKERIVDLVIDPNSTYSFAALLDRRYSRHLQQYAETAGASWSEKDYRDAFLDHFGSRLGRLHMPFDREYANHLLAGMAFGTIPEPRKRVDPLVHWQSHLGELPKFFCSIIRMVFCVYPTSTSVERSFKDASLLYTKNRASLSMKVLEKLHLICRNKEILYKLEDPTVFRDFFLRSYTTTNEDPTTIEEQLQQVQSEIHTFIDLVSMSNNST